MSPSELCCERGVSASLLRLRVPGIRHMHLLQVGMRPKSYCKLIAYLVDLLISRDAARMSSLLRKLFARIPQLSGPLTDKAYV
jgi:hypothetical protein